MSEKSSRYQLIEGEVKAVLKNLSGRNLDGIDTSATFFDLGFDSLLLTQASQSLRQKFGVKISFRQLLEDLVSIAAVSGYLDEKVPADKIVAPASAPVPQPKPVAAPKPVSILAQTPASVSGHEPASRLDPATGSTMDRIVKQQLQLMARQLELLRGRGGELPVAAPELNGNLVPAQEARLSDQGPLQPERKVAAAAPDVSLTPRYFGPFKPIDKSPGGGLTDRQQKHLDDLIRAYVAKTPRSKAYTQRHRAHLADPRTVSGFRQTWKEIVYPIVVKQSAGSRLWDLDNNEYLDVTLGFGTHFFGHSPDFAVRAQQWQLRKGVEVGPQSPLVGKVAELMCELTGMERVAFCNTGSEAVLAAIRLARTVTGRVKIATMSGAYHGINDEVLVRGTVVDGKPKTIPIAPGIPQHIVDEVLVLEYGSPEALEILQQHAHELAAVLVEPVQSRQPDLAPVEFLREVRRITEQSETALIFDELVTGFRVHPGGCQALWGIRADMATYGKVIGGGMPIGALCGKAMYLDALDGGNWQYGDGSFPEVGVTFFAGTFVRHQLAIRSTLSVLSRIKREGPMLQENVSQRAAMLVDTLNAFFEESRVPMRMTRFHSMMYFRFQEEFKYSSLLFFHLRLRGLHIWEARPVFLSTVHTDEDVAFIIRVFKESLEELRAGGFLPEAETSATLAAQEKSVVPDLPVIETTPTYISTKPMEFSLYFFGNYDAAYRDDKYSLLMEAAKYADANGFTAIWLPERHFHAVGGFSPNSSLLASALAGQTTKLQLRGGSVVLPLHHPVRVAEEWSVVDNLSGGRVAISIASGWHPNDFIFAPEAFEDRRNINLQNLDVIQRLWRGEAVEMPTPGGKHVTVKLFPQPKQRELPVWMTCIHQESYAEAGRKGLNVLGYLMNQTVDELADKIAAYREGRRSVGLDPAAGHVTTLLYTYLDESVAKARETARKPLCDYLRSYLDNSQKKIEKEVGQMEVDEEDVDYLTNRSCDDYFNGKSIIGTTESCAAVVDRLKKIGVDEIGCFVDFGVASGDVLESLKRVTALQHAMSEPTPVADQVLPLPEAEKGLWLLASLEENAGRAYHESITLSLAGELDRGALEKTLQTLVDRHGALRTTINADGQSQTVRVHHQLELNAIDCSGRPETEVEEILAGLENQIFAGMRGPFLFANLLRLDDRRHILLLVFHHVLGNGPSYWVYLDEFTALYQAFSTGGVAQLPPPVPFAEFVEKRRLYEESDAWREAEAFWIKQMEGGVPSLDLPLDYARPAELTYAGAREEIVLEAGLVAGLKKAGAAHRSSLFMMLLSAYGLLLHRLSGQDDLLVGVPFDSPIRMEMEDRNLFANTTNMLPLRSILYDGSSFLDYLLQIKNLVIAASEHQDYFFANLIGKLNVPRDPSRPPFFNVTFNLESGEFHQVLPQLEIRLESQNVPYRSPRGTAMFELYLNAAERKNGEIFVQCDYNTDLIAPGTMQRWLRHFKTLLRGIVADPNQLAALIPLMTAEEQQELVVAGKRTAADSTA